MPKQENKNHIRKKKEVEEKISFFSAIVEQSTEGMALADLKENIFFTNKAWAKMHGYRSSKNLLGVNLAIFHSKKQLREDVVHFNKKVKKYGTYSGEVGHVTKQGIEFSTLMTSTLLKDKDNKPFALLGIAKDITNLKEIQKRLEESEKRFRDISMNIADWIWEVDAEGKYTFVAGKIKNVLGYSSEELIGKTPFDFMPPKEAGRVGKIFKGIVAKKQDIVDLENINLTKSGQKVIILTNGSPLLDHKGSLVGYRGVDKDITKKKEAEELLFQSERNLKRGESLAHMGIWNLDIVNNVLYWSDEIYRIFGLKPQEFGATYEAFLKYIHPDDRDFVNKAYANSLKTKEKYDIEHRIMRPDGEIRFVREICDTIFDRKGKAINSTGTVQDITKKKEIAMLLEDREKEYRSVIENSRDAIYRMSLPDGKYAMMSPSVKDVFGYNAKKFINNPLFIKKIIHPKFKGYFKKQWAQLIKGNVVATYEYKIIDSKGKERWINQSNRGVFDKQGKIIAIEGICRDVTKHKKLDLLLKESENRFRGLFESANDAIFLMKEKFIDCNPATLKMFSCKYNQIVGHSPIEFSPLLQPDGRKSSTSAKEKIMTAFKGRPQRFYWKHKKLNGKLFDAEVSLNRVDLLDGPHIQAIVRDISKEKKIERKLRASEGKIRTITDVAPNAIFAKNKERQYTFVNPAAEKMIGLPISKIIGKKAEQIFSKKDAKIIKKLDDLNFKGKKVDEVQQLMGEDGPFLHTVQAPIFDENKKIIGISGVVRDITDKKKRENKIQEINKELEEQQEAILNVVEDVEKERKKAETYLNIAGNIIIILDNKGKIKLINKKGNEILGYKKEELIGQDWFGICCLPRENLKEVRDVFKKLMQGDTDLVEYYENPIITKSGEERIIGWHNSLLKDEAGNIIGTLSSGEDLTKIKEIDRAKTEFVSLASHQLRTPLSAIHWYTGMLLEGDVGELNKEQKAYMEKIHISNVRMIDLINALLNVSRLELGTFVVETSMVNVIGIAKSVIGELGPSIKEKEIYIKKQFDSSIPKKIKLDKRLIRIIIQNLLSNAIKYTPKKGKVAIKMVKNGKDIKITVSDNGYGIPKFQQEQIFTKLFRADNIKVKDTDGTGLGLYLVKEILEHMGGKVWFKSQENKGSTFYVTFPLKGIKSKKGTRKLEYIK